ncbi:NADPH-dependent F420 reductase [Gorillibacterium sp. sgz5001074]|uniref:NADPH-dependent F420 reductase n=1 Tax=Gorillibacterium sp. sgz5001074 TaxID=3446695 RepID=UPI003F66689A
MKIASMGSGNIGGTLGKRWAALGHSVMFGSRDPHSRKMKDLLQDAGHDAQAGTIREAAAFGDVILLAVPPDGVEHALAEAGDLGGRILINCTNRYDGQSADAEVRRLAKNARIVRAFHTMPWEVLANPHYEGGTAAAFLYGDDSAAVETVARLITELGLDPIDVGGPDEMTALETANGTLWRIFAPVFGREYGLSILRR